ncbi:alkyl/aryl-sulfatase [Thalassolituus sp. LLYu03]|uniref:alkyl/aryl-sulfatase n=1 Tax=Thalassolituus sp. LLYu03 TaxID=3421656 RepID=UPI003D2DFD51
MTRITRSLPLICASTLLLLGCAPDSQQPTAATPATADALGNTAPSAATLAVQQALREQLPLADQQDFDDASRGLMASVSPLTIPSLRNPDNAVWDRPAYDFIQGEAPGSVNPSLWRQAQLNNINGLFEVTPGVYQLRGFDLSNMTLIRGKSGWIIVDPLTAKETAAAAFQFALHEMAKRGDSEQRISAIVFTHSHIDHFGGVLGIISNEDIQRQAIPVVAPLGFMEEATSENMIAGTAMSRRAVFMYGKNLPRNERGHVDSGLGKGPAFGEFSIVEPNTLVGETDTRLTLDGIDFQFQYTPESEAPAEFTFYLPQLKAFCGGEVVSRNMHNLYTLRGAKVRDALKWSGYIEEMRHLYSSADVYFASHHWPMWGKERIQTFLKQQRDTYKFIHDQTVRLMNKGYTPGDIAEQLHMPDSLSQAFSSRGYYGTLKHNARAVYQAYLGWYDANPAHLDPLPDLERAKGYVALAGGADALMSSARQAMDAGNYRWSAELLNHLVFAQPDNQPARELLAASYDQLGYQAESGPWRDAYLTGALELRHGTPETGINIATMKDMLLLTPVGNFFDTMAVRLKAEEAEGKDWRIRVHFTDMGETHLLWLENSVLHHVKEESQDQQPVNATLNLTHALFVNMLIGEAGVKDTLFSDDLTVDGSRIDLVRFFSLFEKPVTSFPVVLPQAG